MDFVNRAKALDGGGCLLEKGCGSLSWVAWDLGMSRNVHSFHFFSIINYLKMVMILISLEERGGVYVYHGSSYRWYGGMQTDALQGTWRFCFGRGKRLVFERAVLAFLGLLPYHSITMYIPMDQILKLN